MTDGEKIMMFAKYMRDRNFDEDRINYNMLVVKLLVEEVLYIFEQGLENIDTYSFEEFTDMATLIDEKLGGREGISKMLKAMQDLTEFLKINKFIKGGKIAHYKRMFSDLNYYTDKYDMMTGRKDNTKEYIKTITLNRFSSSVIKLVDEINVYEFKTLQKIDKILNDVPLTSKEAGEEASLIICMLKELKLIEEKNSQLETTKIGRGISRLEAEERYAALVYLMFYDADWEEVLRLNGKNEFYLDFKCMLQTLSSIFYKNREVILDINSLKAVNEDEILVEIATDRFRIARLESMTLGYRIMHICFVGMGIMEIKSGRKGEVVYRTTDLGQNLFKLVYNECGWSMKNHVESIKYLIKNKNFDKAEISMLEFISTYGGNIVVWDYLGQLLMIKKNYKHAYLVLKHGYENSSKRGKAAKSTLYHLVLCCRKLKYEDDIAKYEGQLQLIEKI